MRFFSIFTRTIRQHDQSEFSQKSLNQKTLAANCYSAWISSILCLTQETWSAEITKDVDIKELVSIFIFFCCKIIVLRSTLKSLLNKFCSKNNWSLLFGCIFDNVFYIGSSNRTKLTGKVRSSKIFDLQKHFWPKSPVEFRPIKMCFCFWNYFRFWVLRRNSNRQKGPKVWTFFAFSILINISA